MREGDDRFDAILETSLDHILVMIQSGLVDRTAYGAERHNAGPGHREAEVRHSNGRKTSNVLFVEVVGHVCNFRVSLVGRTANVTHGSNRVESTRTSAILSESAFDLEGAAGHSPYEILRKLVAINASICGIWTSGI